MPNIRSTQPGILRLVILRSLCALRDVTCGAGRGFGRSLAGQGRSLRTAGAFKLHSSLRTLHYTAEL